MVYNHQSALWKNYGVALDMLLGRGAKLFIGSMFTTTHSNHIVNIHMGSQFSSVAF